MFLCLYLCTLLFGHVFGVLDMCFFIVVLILWYGTCFEVGMNLCMDNFLYDMTVIFGKLCIYFMVDIWCIFFMWYVVCLCSWVSSINHPFYHLRLEVGGYWLVGGNCFCIYLCNSIFLVCIDGLHRAYLIYLIHMLLLMHLAYMSYLIYACI